MSKLTKREYKFLDALDDVERAEENLTPESRRKLIDEGYIRPLNTIHVELTKKGRQFGDA